MMWFNALFGLLPACVNLQTSLRSHANASHSQLKGEGETQFRIASTSPVCRRAAETVGQLDLLNSMGIRYEYDGSCGSSGMCLFQLRQN